MAVALEAVVNYFVITEADGTVRSFPKKSVYYELFKERIGFFVGKQKVAGLYPLNLTGTVTLDTGASGSVNGILANSVELLTGAVVYNTSLPQTATDVATDINLGTLTHGYSAVAVGAVITITNEVLGREVDTFTIVTSVTTITKTDVNMGFETGGLLVAVGGAEFGGVAALLTFVRTNTGN